MTTRPASDKTAPRSAFPFDPFADRAAALSDRWLIHITWGLLILGIVARLARYLLRFPLWPDEAFLSASFLDRGYLGLLQPLEYDQICPLLFLWAQLTCVKLLGFSEYGLRLFPLMCGIGGLLVYRYLAGKLFKGTALALAVGVFAVAYPLIRYSAEAKPYGCDMFVSLVLVTMAVEWYLRPERTRWLWGLTAAVPIAVGLSYPAVFVAGGVSVAVAVVLWNRGCRRDWLVWLVYNLALVSSFGALFALSASNQYSATGSGMQMLWLHTFPPLGEPLKLVGWLIAAHTSEIFNYPVGGPRGASTLTAVCCLVGLVVLIRTRHFGLVALCWAPLALNFIAAALHSYPYGGHVRFSLYAGSIVCLVGALGTAVAISWLSRWPKLCRGAVVLTLTFEVAIALTAMGRDFVKPYKDVECLHDRAFARWFWATRSYDNEVVCLQSDLGRNFSPQTFDALRSSVYLCNQRIYSPRHAERRPPDLNRVSISRPLCCVEFRSSRFEYDEASQREWLAEMESEYKFVSQDEYRFPIRYRGRELLGVEFIEVYEFVPKSSLDEAQASRPVDPVR